MFTTRQRLRLFEDDDDEDLVEQKEEEKEEPSTLANNWLTMLQDEDLLDETRQEHELTDDDWKDAGIDIFALYDTDDHHHQSMVDVKEKVEKVEKKEERKKKEYIVEDVFLAFMNAHVAQSSSEHKRRINRMISYVTGSYTHVETIFIVRNTATSKKKRIVSSVYMVLNRNLMVAANENPSTLRMVSKHDYHRPERWCFFRYKCSLQIKQKMFEYEFSKQGTQFNQLGMFWNFLVPFDFMRVDRGGSHVFCSEQIVRNLQHCEPHLYADLKPYATGPLELFEYIREKNKFERVDEPRISTL